MKLINFFSQILRAMAQEDERIRREGGICSFF